MFQQINPILQYEYITPGPGKVFGAEPTPDPREQAHRAQYFFAHDTHTQIILA